MTTESILKIVSIVLTWCAIITGVLGMVAVFLWICEQLVMYIVKHLKIWNILIEFTFNRAKYKKLMREEDYETLKQSPNKQIEDDTESKG